MGKGPLVKVELEPGRFVQMHKDDAQRLGYLAPKPKKREPAEDKMIKPAEDKAEPVKEPEAEPEAEADILTSIPGIGESTAEELRNLGYYTPASLRGANLGDLPWRARQAVEEWRGRGEEA